MASGFLRSVLSFVLTDSTFTGASERSKLALGQTEGLIKKVTEEVYFDHFDEFAVQLVTALEAISAACPMSGTSKTVGVQREKLWKVFHEKRTTELPELWKHFLQKVDHELDPLVYQTVNQKLFEEIIKGRFGVQPRKSSQVSLTCNEENVVRYASGYIPFVLMKKYEKNPSEASVSIMECLGSMAVNGDESDFLQYTRGWLENINRGGLFEVNDLAYQLFKEIEVNLQDKLMNQLKPSSTPGNTKA